MYFLLNNNRFIDHFTIFCYDTDHIHTCSKEDAKYTLQIVDQTGRILKVEVLNASEGMNIQEFDLEGIAAGMYMIRIVTENNEVINKSIIIQ